MGNNEPEIPQLESSGIHVAGALLAELIAAGGIGVLLYQLLFPSQIRDQTCMTILGLGYAGVVLWLLAKTFSSACPACQRVLVKERLSTKEIGRKKGYKTVEREEKNREGDVIRRWNEQVRILTVSYEHRFKCNNCGQVWTEKSEHETETFTD